MMQYAHIAAVNSAARSQRAVELSAYDLAGDDDGWEEFESSIPGARRKKNASGGYSYKYPKGGSGGTKPAAKRAANPVGKVPAMKKVLPRKGEGAPAKDAQSVRAGKAVSEQGRNLLSTVLGKKFQNNTSAIIAAATQWRNWNKPDLKRSGLALPLEMILSDATEQELQEAVPFVVGDKEFPPGMDVRARLLQHFGIKPTTAR